MGYDRGDSFPFDFKPNKNPFGSKSIGKLSPGSYPIQFERKYELEFSQWTPEEHRKKMNISDGIKRGLYVFEVNVGQFCNSTIVLLV